MIPADLAPSETPGDASTPGMLRLILALALNTIGSLCFYSSLFNGAAVLFWWPGTFILMPMNKRMQPISAAGRPFRAASIYFYSFVGTCAVCAAIVDGYHGDGWKESPHGILLRQAGAIFLFVLGSAFIIWQWQKLRHTTHPAH